MKELAEAAMMGISKVQRMVLLLERTKVDKKVSMTVKTKAGLKAAHIRAAKWVLMTAFEKDI